MQGDDTSTVNFTVQYRGENLAPPVLEYSPTGNHGYHIVHSIILHVLVFMSGDDDVMYIEDDYDGVPIIDGNFTIEDFDHSSYVTNTVHASCSYLVELTSSTAKGWCRHEAYKYTLIEQSLVTSLAILLELNHLITPFIN